MIYHIGKIQLNRLLYIIVMLITLSRETSATCLTQYFTTEHTKPKNIKFVLFQPQHVSKRMHPFQQQAESGREQAERPPVKIAR